MTPAGRRGVNLLVPARGAAAILSTAARYELRDRLLRRFGRNLTTLGPLFTGAAIAAWLNRRATLHPPTAQTRMDNAIASDGSDGTRTRDLRRDRPNGNHYGG